jgi:hypothetical protein
MNNVFCKFCHNAGIDDSKCYGHHPGPNCPTLRETICQRCDEKGHTKSNCTFCFYCFEVGIRKEDCYGHYYYQCPTYANIVCSRCNRKGHTQKYCPAPFCNFCYLVGHKIDNCEILKEKKRIDAEKYCNFCEEKGHSIRQCKNPYNSKNRR